MGESYQPLDNYEASLGWFRNLEFKSFDYKPEYFNLPNDYLFANYSWGKRFYKVYGEGRNYADAKAVCESDGAFLAIPRSDAENDFIEDLIPNEYIWIGLNDIDQEGVFVTVDGTDSSYTHWYELGGIQIEPNNFNDEEHAVVILPGLGRWNDVALRNLFKFVCTLTPDN